MKTRPRLALVSLAILAFVLACNGDPSGPPAVAIIEIRGLPNAMSVPTTAQLTTAAYDANGNPLFGRTTTWSTSDVAIATVGSTTGLVTAVAPGYVTITATMEGTSKSQSLIILKAPIASVTVSVASNTLQIGQTTQAAAVVIDQANKVVTDQAVAWSSWNPAVASVSATGVITALSPGATNIVAVAGGVAGNVVGITVTRGDPAKAPQITAVTPSPMVEGQPATITGSKFGATPGANVVRVDGVAATVTAVSASSLQIIVPKFNCRPAVTVVMEITVGPNVSDPSVQRLIPNTTFTLAPGKQRLITNPADFCLQFPATTATESYLIGVQSVTESAASVTGVMFAGVETGSYFRNASSARASAPALSANVAGVPASPFIDKRAQRFARHHAVESRLLRQEGALLRPRLRSFSAARGKASASVSRSVSTVPVTAKVGDVLNIRVPSIDDETCQAFTPIAATVKAVGTHSVILEDNDNPSGGFSDSDYQALSSQLDAQIYPTNTSYFGTPTDFDGNNRIAIVITKEINKISNLLGVVFFVNFIDQGECAASNEGEFFYGIAPDPDGTVGDAYSVADARADAPVIISHEFTHVIQIGRRLEFTAPNVVIQSTWELEGQATFAEEVNGFAATGLGPGRNLGLDVVFNEPALSPSNWFLDPFVDLFVYYGLGTSPNDKSPNAPELCSWLGTESEGNTGPCLGDYPVYGASWSFLRWLSDQFGPTFPGGEKGLHQKLVDNSFSGFATISDVVGVPIDVLLAQWAAALYTDDRAPGLDPRLTFTSWNLAGIETGVIQPARLVPRDRTFGTFSDWVSVRGGSTAYFLVHSNGRPATGIRARDQSDGTLPSGMRMWVVRLR